MVNWRDALSGGVEVFLYVLAWQFLGFLIADAISGGFLHGLILNPIGTGSITGESIRSLIIGLWIGGVVASIGAYASIIKVSIEISRQL